MVVDRTSRQGSLAAMAELPEVEVEADTVDLPRAAPVAREPAERYASRRLDDIFVSMMTWKDHQEFEAKWHGICCNTFGEEVKQLSYAARMGLINDPHEGHWPSYDAGGKSVLDIGGGPSSMLLKTRNVKRPTVVDPCVYPDWIYDRYALAGIRSVIIDAERFDSARNPSDRYDECWIYNVLQHTQDPQKIIENARGLADTIRIFEWIDMEPEIGHPHKLTENDLNSWLSGSDRRSIGVTGAVDVFNFGDSVSSNTVGKTEMMTGENGCHGRAYFGVFTFGGMP